MASSCWLWDGSYFPSGYGQAWSTTLRRGTQAHRLAYEKLVGPIPEGLQLDHLCRVRGCVNPEHLRVVTCQENILADGSTCVAAVNAVKAHCLMGHAFDERNTYVFRGSRHCRSCRAAEKRRRRERNSARGISPALDAVVAPGTRNAATSGSSVRVVEALRTASVTGANVLEK